MSRTVLILNGPSLNLLGTREPEIYGTQTLGDIEAQCRTVAGRLGLTVDFRQSNHEGELVSWVHEARDTTQGLIVNAAAYSHTSVALLDALLAYEPPVIEVHLSNLFRREAFRHHSHVSSAAQGMICGLGARGYTLALEALAEITAAKTGDKTR